MSRTTMRGEIRRLTRSGDSRVICPVTVQRVEALTPHFSRVTVQGDGLAAYRTILPADAFKLMIPPDGVGSVRMPKMSPDGLPVWPQDRPMPLMRAFTVRTFDPETRRLTFDVAVHGTTPMHAPDHRNRSKEPHHGALKSMHADPGRPGPHPGADRCHRLLRRAGVLLRRGRPQPVAVAGRRR
ncbi:MULTISPECIES: siderophore-interacting protein [unclassified Kribbella]|uniref:siderophore-interacting protein n=1 Tax=unclassified Kribbella TaxID=2644121 RepID=UPI0033FA0A94